MLKRTIDQLRCDYIKMFSNLPLGMRDEIIAVMDKGPMTYSVIYLEVKAKTKMSEKILRYLEELDLV